MKQILIKSVLENIQTESGKQNITNTVLNVVKTNQDTQKIRVLTELFMSENAIDAGGLALTDKSLSNIPLNLQLFEKQMIVLVCDYLKSKGIECENLTIRDHIWTNENQPIRVFMTDRQCQEISFGVNYQLIAYVHDKDIIKEINSIGTWLYLTTLLHEHEAILKSIGVFIQTKIQFDEI